MHLHSLDFRDKVKAKKTADSAKLTLLPGAEIFSDTHLLHISSFFKFLSSTIIILFKLMFFNS